MPLVTPDFSEVSEDRAKIEPGVYKVRIVKAEIGQWEGRDGKPATSYVKWEMDIFGDEKLKGRKLWTNTPLNGKGAFKSKNLYKAAMGEDPVSGSEFDTDMLLSKEMEVTLTEGKPNAQGKVYTDISVFKPIQ